MTLAEDILRLKAEGKTYKKIAETLNCSKGTISYHVGEGQKDKQITRQRDRRNAQRKYIQGVKQSKPCADCGENYPYYMMDFDHLGDKAFGIAKLAPTMKALKAEIAKCDLVCANCHRIRTYQRLVRHGSDSLDIAEFYA